MKINREGLGDITKSTYLQYLKLFPVLKKERNKKYGMIVFTFVTMTFFAIFAINPTLTTIAELHRKLEDTKFAEGELSRKINNLSLLQNQYSSLSPDLAVVLAGIPLTTRAPFFAGQLQAIANQSNVSLGSLNIGELTIASTEPNRDGNFMFTLQATGTFSQVDTFLKNLTQFERIVVIDSLSISKQAITDTTMSVAVSGTARYME